MQPLLILGIRLFCVLVSFHYRCFESVVHLCIFRRYQQHIQCLLSLQRVHIHIRDSGFRSTRIHKKDRADTHRHDLSNIYDMFYHDLRSLTVVLPLIQETLTLYAAPGVFERKKHSSWLGKFATQLLNNP